MTVEPSNDDRMAVMHRLLEPSRRECDEDRARQLLYGSPRQDVTRIEPTPPTRQSDAPAAANSRGA